MEIDSALTAGLAVLDPVSSSKGGQRTSAIIRNGQTAFWTFPSLVTPLWQPSAFKNASGDQATGRFSLCLRGDDAVINEATALDEWAISYATAHSERLFGKTLSRDQIIDRYSGVVKKSTTYPSYVKIKIGTDRNAPNYWGCEKERREEPMDFTLCQLHCRVKLVSFWFMNSSFGLTCQLVDAQVLEESRVACPF